MQPGQTELGTTGPDPETRQTVGQTGQAVRPPADPAAPHLHIDKPGGTAGDQNRLRNPGLQLREITPQTSD